MCVFKIQISKEKYSLTIEELYSSLGNLYSLKGNGIFYV